MMDFRSDPPIYKMTDATKRECFDPLVPTRMPGSKRSIFQVEVEPAIEAINKLMRIFSIRYDVPDADEPDLTEDEQKLLYPFAFTLACLDGNAFNGPIIDSVWSYTSDAYKIIAANRTGETREQIFAELRKIRNI